MLENSPAEIDRPVKVRARINIINSMEGILSPRAGSPDKRTCPEIENLKRQIADLYLQLADLQKSLPVLTAHHHEVVKKATVSLRGRISAWFKRQKQRGEESS